MKIIDYKKINMTDEEYKFYEHLTKVCSDQYKSGQDYFKDLFDVDDEGYITMIRTDKSVPWAIMFFIQQLMISQRLRFIDDFRKKNG